MVWQI
jgi:hypothetical protein